MEQPFVHLHLHTMYSLLDGAIKPRELARKLKEDGMQSVAITDHGCMFGAIDFYRTMQAAGIKPILGCEVYVAPGSMQEKRPAEGVYEGAYHLVLLAENAQGYQNLIYMVSRAYLEGFYYKPRVDKELLREHSEGIIALSACLGGEVPNQILAGNLPRARETALEYNRIFGQGNFYLELQENGMEDQRQVNRELIALSEDTGIPLVATNDCHYLDREDARAHDILMCIQTQRTLDDDRRFKFDTDQLYVKTRQDMWRDFGHVTEALENTVRIADRCNLEIEFGQNKLPRYDVPAGHSLETYIRQQSEQGLLERFAQFERLGQSYDPEQYHQRLAEELQIINDMGYPGYFIIVADFIQWAKEQDIPVGPGRGSAAGSLVAYALKITDIDPIPYNLLFERFLNPERVSMPDIDVDFCMNRRSEVIEYVRKKYGQDNVCQIITYGALLAKGVIRDVTRVLGLPYAEGDKLAKLVPDKLGISLDEALETEPEIRRTAQSMAPGEDLLRYARALEGLYRNAGVHAAGIVITDEPIYRYAPLSRGQDGEAVCQFDKDDAESIGLVKFDFLGLKTLTVIEDACRLIQERTGLERPFDIDAIPMDDADSYELLCRGCTTGVFQLESGGMKNLIRKLQPSGFEDIIALVALYRPGPLGSGMVEDFVERKHGLAEIEYPLPELEPILRDTYGVIVYQEQVMQIARTLGGYSLGAADLLRRAMGKKKPEEMERQKKIFLDGDGDQIPGAVKLGIDRRKAEEVFDLMAYFAGYGFNKSHSAAYALIAYQTAYLKAHYPAEFMAALMTSEMDNTDKVVNFINECRDLDIAVEPPDVNKSGCSFGVDAQGSIIFGMSAIKNVGAKAVEEIIAERTERGPFRSIHEFTDRVDLRAVNKRVVEQLIKCGAFDLLHGNRFQVFSVLEEAFAIGQRAQKERAQGQVSLFALAGDAGQADDIFSPEEEYPDVQDWDKSQRLAFEKETLGYYVTGHPLDQYRELLRQFNLHQIGDLQEYEEGTLVRMAGMLCSCVPKLTKAGRKMAICALEDLSGKAEMVVFPKKYEQYYAQLSEDALLVAEARVNDRDGTKNLVLEKVYDFDAAQELMTSYVEIGLDYQQLSTELFTSIEHQLQQFPGEKPLFFRISHNGAFEARIRSTLQVVPRALLYRDLNALLGKGAVRFAS